MSLYDRQTSGVVRPSSISKKNISEAKRPILIKFNVNYNWDGGLIAVGFWTDCIKIVVSMAIDSSHRLTMEKLRHFSFLKQQGAELLYFVCSNAC